MVFDLNRVERPSDGTPICSLGRPFPAGTEVPIDGAYSVEAARFTPNQSVAYLSLCPPSGLKTACDLYTSPLLDGRFTSYTKLAGVSDATHYDSYPTISPDGRYLVFSSNRMSQLRVFVAAASGGSFDQPVITPLSVIPNMIRSNEPYLVNDGRVLYLSGASPDSQTDDIYRAAGEPPLYGGTAEIVAGIETAAGEYAPVVANDELEIFFASDRVNGNFELDLYTATRTSTAMPFDPPVRIDSLSTDGIDWPLWLSPDACDLYYINKPGAFATMYVSHR